MLDKQHAGIGIEERGAALRAVAEDQQIVGPRDHWVNVLTHLATDLGFSTFDGSSSSMDVDGELTRVIPSEATTYYNYD